MINLKHEKMLGFFRKICSIPHISYHTDELRDYIENFAITRHLDYYKDDFGNILVYKDASEGYENHDTVILQGHIDMVAASKNPEYDLVNSPVIIDEEAYNTGIMKACGTTLGADDGIAVAYMLAILDDDSLRHPGIEALFTTNEEVGLTGASYFDCSKLKGRRILNLDSEEEGVFLTGSAGGIRVDSFINLSQEVVFGEEINIKITGLKGGHSGDKIGTGRASANSLMLRLINALMDETDIAIHSVRGGTVDNAIANECECLIIAKDPDEVSQFCLEFEKSIIQEYFGIEDNISILVGLNGTTEKNCIQRDCSAKIKMLFSSLPQGVIARNAEDVFLVETSLNLGILDISSTVIKYVYLVRSSYESAKLKAASDIRNITEGLMGKSRFSGNYPGWSYNPESELRSLIGNVYTKQTGKNPVFKTIHAGLECGIFYNALNNPDIVSYGPDIHDIHTAGEWFEIESAIRVYELTTGLLEIL